MKHDQYENEVDRARESEDMGFGSGLAKALSVRPEIATLRTVPWIGDKSFAVTRIKTTGPIETVKFDLVAAILVSVAVDPVAEGKYQVWIDGKEVECLDFLTGSMSLVDLQTSPELWADCPVDSHYFYLPCAELSDIVQEHGIATLGSFGAFHGKALLIARLASLLALPSASTSTDVRLGLDCVKLSPGSYLIQRYAGLQGPPPAAPVSQLAPWRKSWSMSILRNNLCTTRLADVAKECRLSPSHFAHCFKATFATSVHQ